MKNKPPDDAKPTPDHALNPTPLDLGGAGISSDASVAPTCDQKSLNSTAILRNAMERSRNCLFPSLKQVLDGSGPYLEPLGTCIRQYLSEVIDDELARLAFGNALLNAGRSEGSSRARHALHQEARRVVDLVRQILQRANAAGECDPNLDPGVWAEVIGRTLFGSISSVAADHGRSMDTSPVMPAIRVASGDHRPVSPLKPRQSCAIRYRRQCRHCRRQNLCRMPSTAPNWLRPPTTVFPDPTARSEPLRFIA
ncbi:hypothetical protein [Paracidovorax citrulli]